MRHLILIVSVFCMISCVQTSTPAYEGDTFRPLKDGFIPQTVDELWNGYDPTKEPLDIEVLDQWEEDNVICQVIRYRVGIFKGEKSMMAAVYAYPKDGKNIPGLVQVHGGGQNANLNAVITNAKRGYACISVNWLGNQMTGLKNGKDWKWEGLNTDWGSIDATQNTHNDHFGTLTPDSKTIDAVYSPRNNNWFLGMIAVRRAITFLQHQPEVNPELIGLYGHSMGGKLTFDVSALDKRIKAAAPSSGKQLEKEENQESEIMFRTIASKAYASSQTCPMILLNPSNDFHGRIEDIEEIIDAIPTRNYMLTRDPYLNHRTKPNHVVCGLLWMDQHLKGNFTFPDSPQVTLNLDASDSIPQFLIKPDVDSRFLGVDVYYSQGSEATGRYWEWVQAQEKDGIWTANCPILSNDETLRVYANIHYSLSEPVTGASYYYQIYTTNKFTISSRMLTAKPEQLKKAGIKITDEPSLLIESFDQNWEKRWYEFNDEGKLPYRTRKLNDKKWQAPSNNAKLSLEILCSEDNILQLELDEYYTVVKLTGKPGWQEIELKPFDFKLKDNSEKKDKIQILKEWTSFKELVIGSDTSAWKGKLPLFKNLRWKL